MNTNEPLWTVSGITAAATAVIALLVSFGLDLSADQQTAILGVIAVLAPVIVALVTRGKVTPTAKVAETVESDGTRIAGPASPLPTGMVIED